MTKKLWIVAIPFILAGCISAENKKKMAEAMKEIKESARLFSAYEYIDSRDTLLVMHSTQYSDNLDENSNLSFSDPARPMLSYSGQYNDGLKNGAWTYLRGLKNIVTIHWAPFTIGNYGIRTNLSKKGSIANVDEHTSKYVLVTSDSIIINFYADTLNARVKRRPYEDVVKEQMQGKGFELRNTENKLLQDTSNFVSVTAMTFTNNSGKTVLYKTAYVVLKSGYLAYAMQYGEDLKNQAELLFDGVLTNLYLNEERFYYPFRKNEKTIEQPEKDSL
jgi:hypothetical protein